MLQNASFTVFNVFKLLREKQEGAGGRGGGGGVKTIFLHLPKLGLKLPVNLEY